MKFEEGLEDELRQLRNRHQMRAAFIKATEDDDNAKAIHFAAQMMAHQKYINERLPHNEAAVRTSSRWKWVPMIANTFNGMVGLVDGFLDYMVEEGKRFVFATGWAFILGVGVSTFLLGKDEADTAAIFVASMVIGLILCVLPHFAEGLSPFWEWCVRFSANRVYQRTRKPGDPETWNEVVEREKEEHLRDMAKRFEERWERAHGKNSE